MRLAQHGCLGREWRADEEREAGEELFGAQKVGGEGGEERGLILEPVWGWGGARVVGLGEVEELG